MMKTRAPGEAEAFFMATVACEAMVGREGCPHLSARQEPSAHGHSTAPSFRCEGPVVYIGSF